MQAKLKDLIGLLVEMWTLSAMEGAKGFYLYGPFLFAQLLDFERLAMKLH